VSIRFDRDETPEPVTYEDRRTILNALEEIHDLHGHTFQRTPSFNGWTSTHAGTVESNDSAGSGQLGEDRSPREGCVAEPADKDHQRRAFPRRHSEDVKAIAAEVIDDQTRRSNRAPCALLGGLHRVSLRCLLSSGPSDGSVTFHLRLVLAGRTDRVEVN
jgi:hypothetical protein